MFARTLDGELRAEVKTGNVASVRVAEAAGFRLRAEVDGVLHLPRPPPSALRELLDLPVLLVERDPIQLQDLLGSLPFGFRAITLRSW